MMADGPNQRAHVDSSALTIRTYDDGVVWLVHDSISKFSDDKSRIRGSHALRIKLQDSAANKSLSFSTTEAVSSPSRDNARSNIVGSWVMMDYIQSVPDLCLFFLCYVYKSGFLSSLFFLLKTGKFVVLLEDKTSPRLTPSISRFRHIGISSRFDVNLEPKCRVP